MRIGSYPKEVVCLSVLQTRERSAAFVRATEVRIVKESMQYTESRAPDLNGDPPRPKRGDLPISPTRDSVYYKSGAE